MLGSIFTISLTYCLYVHSNYGILNSKQLFLVYRLKVIYSDMVNKSVTVNSEC